MDRKSVDEILNEVRSELSYQAQRWANGDLDQLVANDLVNNSAADFAAYISHYSTKWFPGGFPPYSKETLEDYRRYMLKTAALAVSAVRWVEAKLEQDQVDGGEQS